MAVKRTPLRHSAAGLGHTYWILLPQASVAHVSEQFGGRNLSQVLTVERVALSQQPLTVEARRLIEESASQYSGVHIHEIRRLLKRSGVR